MIGYAIVGATAAIVGALLRGRRGRGCPQCGRPIEHVDIADNAAIITHFDAGTEIHCRLTGGTP